MNLIMHINYYQKKNIIEEDEDLYDKETDKSSILTDYISNGEYDKLGAGTIGYVMKNDKLNELTIENNFIVEDYSYKQKSIYKDLKINEPVEFKYNLSELKILTDEETEEMMSGLMMTIFMFAMMQMSDMELDVDSMDKKDTPGESSIIIEETDEEVKNEENNN